MGMVSIAVALSVGPSSGARHAGTAVSAGEGRVPHNLHPHHDSRQALLLLVAPQGALSSTSRYSFLGVFLYPSVFRALVVGVAEQEGAAASA
jgi:hypothetical protein